MQLEETKKFELQYVRNEEGRLLRNKGYIRERWVRFFRSPHNEIRHTRYRHSKAAAAVTLCECPRDRAHGAGGCYSDEGDVKRESSRVGRPSRGTAETRITTWPEHMFGVPPTRHPHLARGTTVMERRSHCRTQQEGRQDGVRKLPRHLARVYTWVRCCLKYLPGDLAITVRPRDLLPEEYSGF